MTIYVQSRGKAQDHDHCWLEVTKDAQTQISPPALKEIKPEELIDSQRPSIILARSGKHLVLLVMALKAKDARLDFMGRQIRNSVAWVEENTPDKERLLRRIAIRALNGKLVKDVDDAVTSEADSMYGFEAKFDKLRTIGNSLDSQDVNSEEANLDIAKFGNNSKKLKDELISELTRYALPISSDDIQIFVVDTTLKSLGGLKAKEVWRGLSSRVESEDWMKFDVPKSGEPNPKDSKKKLLIGVVALLLVGIIAAVTVSISANHPIPQNAQPESMAPLQPSEIGIAP